jgi:hypothetical protein
MFKLPPQHLVMKLMAAYFSTFFGDTVSKIRSLTATATPPVIADQSVPGLCAFMLVTVADIVALFNSSPWKLSDLDPNPTLLLIGLSTRVTPIMYYPFTLSLESGISPC